MTKTDERPTPETVDILRQKLRVAERVKQAAIDCTKSWDNILDELVWERPDIDAHEIPADYLSAMIARYPHHAEALADFAKRWNSDKPIPDEELADMEIDEESVKRSTASCLMMLKWSTRIRNAERSLREAQAKLEQAERDAKRYRWLRERSGFRSDPPVVDIVWNVYRDGRYVLTQSKYGDELDAAIDAAIAKDDTHGNG